jgi:membrane associated rhomboid family serine protease
MANQQYQPSGFGILPPVVKNLIIINGLFFIGTIVLSKVFDTDLTDVLGLHYFAAEKFRPWQLITYMFMHGNFSHIFFNMFAVWMFGSVLENYWGAKKFLIYYFVTGIGAAIVHYTVFYFQLSPVLNMINNFLDKPSADAMLQMANQGKITIYSSEMSVHYNEFVSQFNRLLSVDNYQATQLAVKFIEQYRIDLLNAPNVVGASGAIFGLLLAFGMMFPNSMIYLYMFIPMKAKWFVVIYGGLELFLGVTGYQGNVAHFAHLGGMLFGFLLLMYWKRKSKKHYNPYDF